MYEEVVRLVRKGMCEMENERLCMRLGELSEGEMVWETVGEGL